MSNLKVTHRTRMREQPSRTANVVRTLEVGTNISPTGDKQVVANEEWQKATFVDPGAAVSDTGWVPSEDLQEAVAVRPPVDPGGFVRESILAERIFNEVAATAPWLVSANFIIARALIETGITNAEPKIPGSDGVGPLQVSTAEWQNLLGAGGVFGAFSPIERDSPITQIYGAGLRMSTDAKAISDLMRTRPVKPIGTDADPFIPSLLDVFIAYLTGSPAAAAAIFDANADPATQTKPLNAVLSPSLTDPQITTFFTARGKYTGAIASPKTVGEFVAAVEADLNDALKKAFDLMKEHAPEELMQVKQGEAPWFDVALEEEKKNVDEADPGSKATILGYFDATNLTPKPTSVATPWCGAFAAHCMKTSNNPVPTGAAAARSWKSWGVGLPAGTTDIPRGAVIVLSPAPPGTGSTGHVAFFNQFVEGGKKIELLGGNQSNKLKRTAFSVSMIAAIRWIDSAPTNSKEQFEALPSQTKISDEAFKLILDSEISSRALYEKKYRGPIWPGFSSGVTIGIGYDIGQTSAAIVKGDWTGVIPDAMLAELLKAVGITGPAARPRAVALKGQVDVPYDSAIKVHSGRVIPRWVAVVEKALPNTSMLSPDSLGALVSLTYNRGPSFSKSGGRYAEMNNIKAFMASKDFAKIPNELIKMKRLWPSTSGLATRRDAEAALFRKGLGP